MRKFLFFTVLLALAFSAYSQNIQNRFLFLEGTAEEEDHLEYFNKNFEIEARTAGYTITKRKKDAAYTFKFEVTENSKASSKASSENSSETSDAPPPDENKFIIKISLVNNKDNEEKVTLDFYFSTLEEMYEYNQFIFHRATVFIPTTSKKDIVDRDWQNKWLSIRASFDYPIIFHSLQPTGLLGGQAVYEGTREEPSNLTPLDHRISPQPGATIGFEFQFLPFMALGGNFQLGFGDTASYSHVNLALGAELKFPIKTRYVVFEPFGAFKYILNTSPIFKEFPDFEFGGGLQVGMRLGGSGTLFFSVSYLHSLTEVIMINSYGPLAPEPPEIYYKRFVLGLGLGYKYGFFTR